MVPSAKHPRPSPSRKPRPRFRPSVELLESRTQPSATAWPSTLVPITESEPNDTLDLANALSLPWTQPPGVADTALAGVQGQIGTGTTPSADVDWYTFTLDRAASVQLTAFAVQGVTVSLYNTDTTSFDPSDPLDHRELAQTQGVGTDGSIALERTLGPGTYDVAVSGLGNNEFNPYLADSGYAGSAGPYQLLVSASALPARSITGPDSRPVSFPPPISSTLAAT